MLRPTLHLVKKHNRLGFEIHTENDDILELLQPEFVKKLHRVLTDYLEGNSEAVTEFQINLISPRFL